MKWMKPKQAFNLFCFVLFQAPTERQLRYKEKVAELRKKRNSGLSKEQKEKYMVKAAVLFFDSFLPGMRPLSGSLVFAVILQHPQLEKLQDSTAELQYSGKNSHCFLVPGAQTNIWQYEGAST